MEMKPDSRARKEPGTNTNSSPLSNAEPKVPESTLGLPADPKTVPDPGQKKPYFILSNFRHPKQGPGPRACEQTSIHHKEVQGSKRPLDVPKDPGHALNNVSCPSCFPAPFQSPVSFKPLKQEQLATKKVFCKDCNKEQMFTELDDKGLEAALKLSSKRESESPLQPSCQRQQQTPLNQPSAQTEDLPFKKSLGNTCIALSPNNDNRGTKNGFIDPLDYYKISPESLNRVGKDAAKEQSSIKKSKGLCAEKEPLEASRQFQSVRQNVKLIFSQSHPEPRPCPQTSLKASPRDQPQPSSDAFQRPPNKIASRSSSCASRPEKKPSDADSNNGKSDEQLCRAFSVDRSLTMTAKISSVHFSESLETDPEVERSMRYEENRTLSFLNEDDELLDKVDEEPRTTALRKNKLKLTSSKFLANKKHSTCESKQSSANPLLNLIANQNFPYYNNPLFVNMSANLSHNNEGSMFSTQDSRPGQNKSTNFESLRSPCEPISEGKAMGPLRLGPPAMRPFPSMPTYSVFPSEIDPRFMRDKLPTVPEHVSVPEFGKMHEPFGLSGFEVQQNLSMVSVPSVEEELNKKSRTRKCQPVTDSKEYGVNVERIIDLQKTTLMIKNIPNRYTKEMMLETIDKKFKDRYNFFYLPIDFDNNCNVGYAFINFIDLNFIKEFYLEFNGKHWPNFKSDKICEITYARIQGKDACIQHFKDSSLMKQEVTSLEPQIQAVYQEPE